MRILKSFAVFTLVISMFSCTKKLPGDVDQLDSELDSASYALGLNMAMRVKKDFDAIKPELIMQGFRNGMDESGELMKVEDLDLFLRKYFAKLEDQKRREAAEKKYGDNRKAGEKFLAENKKKEGVITTESGLQYQVLVEGTGPKVKPENKVKIHYHGTTIDGQVFDSSVNRDTPYINNANIFVPGFNEGLALMRVGSKYKFFIPQELAYGAQHRSQLITPFSALIFEVEVLEIIE